MNLEIDLCQGTLIGATPMGQQAKIMSREPIILSFDSQETRNRVLKAAAEKGRKGAGIFPIKPRRTKKDCLGTISHGDAPLSQGSLKQEEGNQRGLPGLRPYGITSKQSGEQPR